MKRPRSPGEIRLAVLNEHRQLRRLLSELQTLARRAAAADREAEILLRDRGAALHDFFCRHLDLEEEILLPVLRRTAHWGPDEARRMAREHREQRELMDYILRKILDASRPPLLLARDLADLAEHLHRDMVDEEERMLDGGTLGEQDEDLDAEGS